MGWVLAVAVMLAGALLLGWALRRHAAVANPPPHPVGRSLADDLLDPPCLTDDLPVGVPEDDAIPDEIANALRLTGSPVLTGAELAAAEALLSSAWTPMGREYAAEMDQRAGWSR